MTIKTILIVASVGVYSFVNAQQVSYFDENWDVTTKDKMSYYREATKQGDFTLIKDYYKNGVLQMEGKSSDATVKEEVWEGKVTWFYPSGKIQNFGTYKEGALFGPAQSYDEEGRLTEDYTYNGDYVNTGKNYIYKDLSIGLDTNSVNEFKNGELNKVTIYDNDIKGIRAETIYEGEKSITNYYNEKGALITSSKTVDYAQDGGFVEYYYNPMQVAKVAKYGKEGSVSESTLYNRAGKIIQEEKMSKKDGFLRSYDATGKKIGEIIYQFNKEYDMLLPQSGDQYVYDTSVANFVLMQSYKNGEEVLRKDFNEKGIISKESFFSEGYVNKINYYDDKGNVKGTFIYQDGMPYDGILYEEGVEIKYDRGTLVYSKLFYEEGVLMSEKRWIADKNHFETNNFNTDQKRTFSYIEKEVNTQVGFTADITQYDNGKIINKATIVDNVIKSGKLKISTFGASKEIEAKGNWIITKDYNEANKLVSESKILIENNDSYTVLDFYITEDSLLNKNFE